jgi:hypothetical protein
MPRIGGEPLVQETMRVHLRLVEGLDPVPVAELLGPSIVAAAALPGAQERSAQRAVSLREDPFQPEDLDVVPLEMEARYSASRSGSGTASPQDFGSFHGKPLERGVRLRDEGRRGHGDAGRAPGVLPAQLQDLVGQIENALDVFIGSVGSRS